MKLALTALFTWLFIIDKFWNLSAVNIDWWFYSCNFNCRLLSRSFGGEKAKWIESQTEWHFIDSPVHIIASILQMLDTETNNFLLDCTLRILSFTRAFYSKAYSKRLTAMGGCVSLKCKNYWYCIFLVNYVLKMSCN